MVDTSSKVPRRERERQRHRQEILDAARQIVADRGLGGVTVEQVARQAEFAVGSIYRHFSSKEELIQALVGDFVDGLVDELVAALNEEAPFQVRLERFVRLALERQAECRPLVDAVMALPGNIPGPDSELATRMRAVHDLYLEQLEGLVAAGEAEGVLRPGGRALYAIALSSLLHGCARASFFSPDPLGEDPAGQIIAFFLDGARAGGAAS